MNVDSWTISYWDNRQTRHTMSGLNAHQKEIILDGLKKQYYTPLGMFCADQTTIIVTKDS